MDNQYYSNMANTSHPQKMPYTVAIIICSLICMLTFFLPLCSISIISFSGWEISTGTQILGYGAEGSPVVFIVFIIPAILFVISVLFRSKMYLAAIWTGSLHFIILVIGGLVITSGSSGITTLTFWYFLDVISAVAAVLFGIWGKRNFSAVSWVTQKSSETKAAYGRQPHSGRQWAPAGTASADGHSMWECPSCHTANKDSISFCPNCGQNKPAPELWECPSCYIINDNSISFCPNCGQKKPAPAPAPWECPSCHTINDSSINFCPNCGSKKAVPLSSVTPPPPSKWECPACLKMNEPTINFCPHCGRKRG